jgi:ubiquinone/menaquinone biosynthesis C-methylase UbiE
LNNHIDIAPPLNEQLAADAFSRQSASFDGLYAGDTIIQYKRQRVRAHVEQYLAPGSSILELNAGTGDDAVYFASKGHHVHATDIAPGMQERLKAKVEHTGFNHLVSAELCSFTELDMLQQRGPYDLIFSNFAGLNCTDKLDEVLKQLPALLKPGGMITLVILPKFCLWETLLLFKGKFRTATRRFFSRNGASSHVEGVYFKCWYYNPSYITRRLKKSFDLLSIEGLCTFVPPSYMEGFAEKHPRMYNFLVKKESKLSKQWPWKFAGDYYMITLRKCT